jgi:hypothetical protein
MSIETIEELRERLAETEEALARAEREQEKVERLNLGLDDEDDEGPEFVVTGVDDFKVDKQGGIWCGGERIGGPDISKDYDPNTDAAYKNLHLSPRDMQLIGQRSRDEAGRYVAVVAPEPETPLLRGSCPDCHSSPNLNLINPTGSCYDTEQNQAYVKFDCRCTKPLLHEADEIVDRVQAAAIEADELMAYLEEECIRANRSW